MSRAWKRNSSMTKKLLGITFVLFPLLLLLIACGDDQGNGMAPQITTKSPIGNQFINTPAVNQSGSSSQGSTNISFQGIPLPEKTRQLPIAESDLPGSVEYGNLIGFFVNTGDYSTVKSFLTTKMNEKGFKLVRTENSTTGISSIAWTFEKGTDAEGYGTAAFEKVVISLTGPLRGNDITTLEKSADIYKDRLTDGDKLIIIDYYSIALEAATRNVENSKPPVTTSAPKYSLTNTPTIIVTKVPTVVPTPTIISKTQIPPTVIVTKVPTVVQDRTALVTGSDSLNIRETPGFNGKILTTIKSGEKVTIKGGPKESDGAFWYQIEYGGVIGWASGTFLTIQSGT